MKQADNLSEKMNHLLGPAASVLQKVWHVIYQIGLWVYRLRAILLAIPVIIWALQLARINFELLPDMVGLGLQSSGEFLYLIAKEVAVYGPLALTALCLLMVGLSKKTIYPWIISIFSLALPLIILLTNVFPA